MSCEGQRVRDVQRRQERGIDRREDSDLQDQEHEGAELRRRYDAAEGRRLCQVRSPEEGAAKANAEPKVVKEAVPAPTGLGAGGDALDG